MQSKNAPSEYTATVKPTAFEPPDTIKPSRAKRIGWLQVSLGIGILFTALVLYFVLAAKAVIFRATEENALFEISGGFSFPIGESTLLLRGEYQIETTAQGFYPLTETLEVDSNTPAEIIYSLSPLPGDLEITLAIEERVPATAVISGNGMTSTRELNSESNRFLFENLEAGSYELLLDAELYAPQKIVIDVPGQSKVHNAEVSLSPNWGWVFATLGQPEATIAIDGNNARDFQFTNLAIGQNPTATAVRVEAGQRQYAITLNGYKPFEREFKIAKEEELDFGEITLEHVDSQVGIVTQPEGVSVLINQEYVGETPLILDLEPNITHAIEMFKAGFITKSDAIKVEKNSTQNLDYRLDADLIQVSVSLYPETAVLSVNGKDFSRSEGALSLPAIAHNIVISAPGHATQSMEFQPVRGTRQHLQVRLLSDQEALWADISSKYTTAAGSDMKLFRDMGEVLLGSSRRETGRRANEVRWDAVLQRPFYASLTEVTNAQYKLYDPEHSSGNYEGYSLDGPTQPVVSVTWQQAALFCNWLSEKEGIEPFYTTERGFVSGFSPDSQGYRLLTEAEWSWLAKMTPSGLPKKYMWGDEELPPGPIENYADESIAKEINFTLSNINDSFSASAPVGRFPPNQKGLYDLSGNVNEWIHDWYDTAPYPADERIVDPVGPDEGEFHVIRGASWARGYLPQLRLAYRDYDSTGRNDLGFRIARYAM